MRKIKLSSKNQIVVPADTREKLNLKSGSTVGIYPLNDNYALLAKEPKDKDYVESMAGLGKEVWDALGGADKYIQGERDSWDVK